MKRLTAICALFCVMTGLASAGPPNIAVIPNAASIVIPTTELDVGIVDLKQTTTFAGTAGTAWNWQIIKLDIGADKVYPLAWNPAIFKDMYLPLPKKTLLPPARLLVTIKYDILTQTWAVISTNEPIFIQCQTCPRP